MPNTCITRVVIDGDEPSLDLCRLLLDDGQEPVSFRTVIPIPREIEGEDLRSWLNRHWGTTSEPRVRDFSATQQCLETVFYTPWSPPLAVFEALSQRFPLLKIKLDYTIEMETGGTRHWYGGGLVEFQDDMGERNPNV